MKELSIEEKAKRYDEAIKRGLDYIRQTPATEMVTRQSILEHIFPELKESEDERIRKELISFFTERAKHTEDSTFNGLSSKEIIAWLEKQGEQKPADNVDVLMSLDEAIEHCKEKSCGNNACALEHKQLAKWLIELKELKSMKEKEVPKLLDGIGMTQLIEKSALLAEIERRKNYYENIQMIKPVYESNIEDFNELLSFIDTLEVKEVDLDYIKKELDKAVRIYKPVGDFGWGTLYNIAIHFFELGLYSQLSWQDVKRLAEIGEAFMNSKESDNLSEEEYYTEILNKFKAKEGEQL